MLQKKIKKTILEQAAIAADPDVVGTEEWPLVRRGPLHVS